MRWERCMGRGRNICDKYRMDEETLSQFKHWFMRIYECSDGRHSIRMGKYSEEFGAISNGLN